MAILRIKPDVRIRDGFFKNQCVYKILKWPAYLSIIRKKAQAEEKRISH